MGLRKDTRLRSPSHLQFVRGHQCLLAEKFGAFCEGKIEAAHVRTGTDGGMGVKPSDNFCVPLCQKHHQCQHTVGEAEFERWTGLDLKKTAEELARRSPHLKRGH